jgi:hypothetical protein
VSRLPSHDTGYTGYAMADLIDSGLQGEKGVTMFLQMVKHYQTTKHCYRRLLIGENTSRERASKNT